MMNTTTMTQTTLQTREHTADVAKHLKRVTSAQRRAQAYDDTARRAVEAVPSLTRHVDYRPDHVALEPSALGYSDLERWYDAHMTASVQHVLDAKVLTDRVAAVARKLDTDFTQLCVYGRAAYTLVGNEMKVLPPEVWYVTWDVAVEGSAYEVSTS